MTAPPLFLDLQHDQHSYPRCETTDAVTLPLVPFTIAANHRTEHEYGNLSSAHSNSVSRPKAPPLYRRTPISSANYLTLP